MVLTPTRIAPGNLKRFLVIKKHNVSKAFAIYRPPRQKEAIALYPKESYGLVWCGILLSNLLLDGNGSRCLVVASLCPYHTVSTCHMRRGFYGCTMRLSTGIHTISYRGGNETMLPMCRNTVTAMMPRKSLSINRY